MSGQGSSGHGGQSSSSQPGRQTQDDRMSNAIQNADNSVSYTDSETGHQMRREPDGRHVVTALSASAQAQVAAQQQNTYTQREPGGLDGAERRLWQARHPYDAARDKMNSLTHRKKKDK